MKALAPRGAGSRPGDTVSAIGPRGKLLLKQDADWHALIGDETSLPGIHAMLAATDRPAHVAVEVDDPAEWRSLGSAWSTRDKVDVGRASLLSARRASLGATT